MNIEELWDKALKKTEILRSRVHELETFRATILPYVFLAESGLNRGDTVVRQGQVVVERPALIMPSAQFQGFEFESGPGVSEDAVLNFLFVRGVRFPSLRYRHEDPDQRQIHRFPSPLFSDGNAGCPSPPWPDPRRPQPR